MAVVLTTQQQVALLEILDIAVSDACDMLAVFSMKDHENSRKLCIEVKINVVCRSISYGVMG